MMQENEKYHAEEFFLKNFNIDKVFHSIKRTDYMFLYYIKHCEETSTLKSGVYLSELAEAMQLSMPDISKAFQKLYDRGYVKWKTDAEKERTYVELTNKSIELMNDQRNMMQKYYSEISEQISPEDMEITLRTMHKISDILKEKENTLG